MNEKELLLRDAVLTMNPIVIRAIGEQTGHRVMLLSDFDVIHAAAEMIVFAIEDAPQDVREKAENILAMFGRNWM